MFWQMKKFASQSITGNMLDTLLNLGLVNIDGWIRFGRVMVNEALKPYSSSHIGTSFYLQVDGTNIAERYQKVSRSTCFYRSKNGLPRKKRYKLNTARNCFEQDDKSHVPRHT